MKIKFLSFVFLILASISVAIASHVPSVPGGSSCYDLKGSGKAVLVGGIANAGVVGFEPNAGAPSHEYEACVRNTGTGPSGPFRLEGWAWNNNLGWISFYCPGGFGALNLGVACGSYTYGVTIGADGKFDGHAWGDNVGWIRFNNPTVTSQVRIETKDPACQGYVYGAVSPSGKTCPVHADGAKGTHAWSDNVGWIDFDGISMPWFTVSKKVVLGTKATTPPVPPPGGSSPDLAKFSKDLKDGTLPPELIPNGVTVQVFSNSKDPVANNIDKYTVRVNIFDGSGGPISGDRYKITLAPKWLDTVKMDQTTITAIDCTASAKGCAVTRGALTTAFPGIYEAIVTSKAPTSSMNISKILSAPTPTFLSNEAFVFPDKKVSKNDLKLLSVEVSVYDNDEREYVFSEEVKPIISGDLHFKPQSAITTLYDNQDKDTIEATINTDTDFTVAGTGTGNVQFILGLEEGSGAEFNFTSKAPTSLPLATTLSARPTVSEGSGAAAYIKNPYIYSIITDSTDSTGSTGAKYFSNKLPRVEGGFVINPVAMFRGNIYTSGLANPSTAQTLRSIGDVSTNLIRNTVFKNVSNIITGASFSPGSAIINGYGTAGFTFVGTSAAKLLPDKGGVPRVYYVNKGDLILDKSSADITWKGNKTLIVVGGNIYIKSNLYNGTSAGATKPNLGIIVLKDLSASSDTQKKQGHVYIYPNVTNIQANIFADGTVFSYNGGLINSNGEPDSPPSRDDLKKNQLLIEGSVASQNTVGGSLKNPPILGDGTKLANTSKSNVERARLYDLNYLRWYQGIVKIDSTGKPFGKKYVDESTEGPCVYDAKEDPDCAIYSPEASDGYTSAKGLTKKDLGSVYIHFDPPPADLPGFGVTGAFEQRQLQR